MATAITSRSFTLGGRSFSNAVDATVAYDHDNNYELTPNLAYALSSWVKTDADTAAGNLTAGHGQTTGTYDVYWTGGQRYGVTCTITTNAVALDGGSGDNFPETADATVTICKQKTATGMIDGDRIEIAGIFLDNASDADAVGRIVFKDNGGSAIATLEIAAGGNGKMTHVYNVDGGDSNPFTGNVIETMVFSQSSGTATGTIYCQIGENAQ